MDRLKSLNIAAVIDAYPLPNATFTPSYGTAGFRAKADLLRSTVFRCGLLTAARALTLRQHCGIMVTASHNAEHDNGVKIVEPTGEMLVQAWEEHATALACATSTTAVLALLQQLLCASQLTTRHAEAAGATEVATGAERAAGGGAAAAAGAAASEAGSAAAVGSPSQVAVVIGWDTRPSAPDLVAAARAGVEALGVAVIPLGQLTTPQLHFQLAMLNQGRLLWPPPTPCVPAPQPTPQPAASQQHATHSQPAAAAAAVAAAADASACPAGDAATPSAAVVGDKASGRSEAAAPAAPCCSVLSLDLYFHTLTNAFHQLLALAAPCSSTPTPALAAPCSPTPAAAPSSGTVGQGGGASSSSAAAPLYVDCANGVGAEQLRRAARLLRPPPPHPAPSLGPSPPTASAAPLPVLDLVLVNEGGAAGGRLNHECGADYVQKERCAPAGFEGLGQEARCCSIDGDGDRLVYFQLLEGPGGLAGFLSLEAAHHAAQLASSQGPQRRDVHRARWAHVKQGLALYAQRSIRAQRREQQDLQHRREKAATAARAHVVSQLRRAGQPGDADLRAAVQLGEVAALAGVQDRQQGALRSMQASAVLDQCYGDRSSFYFYHRDQPAHTPTLISSLQLPTQPGQVADLSSPAGVLAACRVFEQHFSASSPTGVYAAKPVDPAARATLLASLTSRLTPAQANSCEGPGTDPMLSAEELGHALQGCAHSKAPGKDGLPMEVYDRLWPQLVGPLRAMLREALADTTDPAPLAEFLTGVITLVPKAGKPRDQVAGYRPITLLNCDVRLVARALEDRLQQPLDLLVSLSQSAFILGRDISDNVQFHLSLLEYLQQRGSPAWLLLLDLAGAYDNVSWGLLQDTMEAMGFRRDGHVRWAQLLHRGASSQVLVNGRLTDSFPLASGLLQGSGASPLYWCIALQPLVSYLSSLQLAGRINTPTIPHSPLSMCQPTLLPVLPSKEYADDLTIAVLDRVRDGAVVLEALGLFQAAGGPALSVAKSSALSCGQPVEVSAAGQEGGRAGAGSQRGEGNAGAASTGEGRVTGWVGGSGEGGTGADRAQRDKSGTVSLERGRGTGAGHGRGAGSSKDGGGERLDEGGGGQEHQQHRSLRQVPPSSTVAANPSQLASAGGGRTEVEGGGGGAGGEGVARSRGRGRGKGGAERGGQVWEGQGAGEGEGGAGPGTGAGAVTIPPSPQGVPVRHLGVPLGAASYSAMSEAAFGGAATVMVAASLPWRPQGLNLLGRVQVAQQCLASKAIYQMAFVQPLAAAGVAMGKAVKHFVAASDLPQERSPNMACLYPNDATCVMPRREGGLGLPDLEITSTAMLAKTVAQLFSPRVREWQPLLHSLLADPQHSLSTWVVTDPTASPVPNLSPRLQAHVTAIAQLKLHRVVAPAAQSHFSVLAEPLRFNALVGLRGRPDSDPLAVEALRWTHVRHVREALHRPRSAFVSAEQQAAVRWEADMARATLPEPWQQVVDVRQLPAPEWECAWGGTGFLVRRVPSQRPTHWVLPSGRLVALDAQGQGPLGAVGVLPGEEWQAAAVVLLDKPHYRLSPEERAAHMRPLPKQRGGAAAPAALEPRGGQVGDEGVGRDNGQTAEGGRAQGIGRSRGRGGGRGRGRDGDRSGERGAGSAGREAPPSWPREEWLLGPWSQVQLDPQVWGMGNTSLLVLTVKAARLRLTQLQRARFDPTYPASGGLWPALWGPRPPPGAEPPQGLAVTGAGLRTLEQRWLDSATLLAAQRAAGEREQQGRDVEELLPEEVQGSQTPRWRATNARPPPRPTPELRAVQRAQRQLDAQIRPGRGGRHSGNRQAGALPDAGNGALDGMVDELARSAQAGQPCLEVWQELLDPTLRREHVIVAWRVLHGSLMVGAMWGHILKEAAAPASSVCRLCQLGPLETLTHAFLTCPSVAPAWEWVLDVYERLTGTRPPSSDALLLLSGRPTHSEDGPFHPPDAHLWLRLRVAYLGSVWRIRCLGPAAAHQTQSLAHRVAQGVIFTLSSAVQRDWYRVGRDIRVGLGGAVPSTWFKGRDPRLDERKFASLWPAASGGWFQRQQGELVVRLSLQWPVPAPPILGAAAEPG